MILTPDKIRTENCGNGTISIKEKIIPDNAVCAKDIAPWCMKGKPCKPGKSLNDGSGVPRGITVHNTGAISVSPDTTMAEQYTRATYPNGNMGGVVVHFFVWHDDIWQNLKESETAWHASDGSARRVSHRAGKTICGNIDTIAIECISDAVESEVTTQKLVAYLCAKYNLDPSFDVYTHNYFMGRAETIVAGASKNCPIYILPHWSAFLNEVKKYYYLITSGSPPVVAPPMATLKSIEEIAREVLAGRWGNGNDRVQRLTAAGYNALTVQAAVNALINNRPPPAVVTPPVVITPSVVVAPASKKAGDSVLLSRKPLYVSATARLSIRKISGTYFLYDGVEVNGRYRITNSEKRVSKQPAAFNVTGWVAL